MASSRGHVRFAMTYNGPEPHPNLLAKLNAYVAESCKDTHGFTYATFKIFEPMLSGAVEDVINDWNLEQQSDDDKIRLHPFHSEEKIVALANDFAIEHFIVKKIDEQDTEDLCGRPSTFHRWRKGDKKRKASEDSDDESSLEDLVRDLSEPTDKYTGKSKKELKTLLSARDDWMNEKNSKIESLREEIKSNEVEIARIEEKLRSKDDVIKGKDDSLMSKDEVIRTKDQVIKAKDQTIMNLCSC
jgi:hypothetical protein